MHWYEDYLVGSSDYPTNQAWAVGLEFDSVWAINEGWFGFRFFEVEL